MNSYVYDHCRKETNQKYFHATTPFQLSIKRKMFPFQLLSRVQVFKKPDLKLIKHQLHFTILSQSRTTTVT